MVKINGLTTKNLMPQANDAAGERGWGSGGRLVIRSNFAQNRTQQAEIFGKFTRPNRAVESFVQRVPDQKLGFQLENLHRFFGTAVVVAGLQLFRRTTGGWILLATGIRIACSGFECTGIYGLVEQRKGCFTNTIAIDLLYADAYCGAQQRKHPKPED